MTTLITLSLVFMGLSAFFSGAETALFSIPRERIDSFKNHVSRPRRFIYALLLDGQRTLMLLLLCNLFVNITLTGLINSLVEIILGAPAAHISFIASVAVILTFGEIVPKVFAMRFNVTVASIAAPILVGAKTIASPILNILQWANRFFMNWFRVHLKNPTPFVTIEELKTAVRELFERGAISKSEQKIVSELLDKGAMPAARFMTHRSRALFLPHYTSAADAINSLAQTKQTYALITRDEQSRQVVGTVHISELLRAPPNERCRRFAKPPQWIPATIGAADLATYMFANKLYIVCLLDEFGSLSGVFELNAALAGIMNFRKERAAGANKYAKILQGGQDIDSAHEYLPQVLIDEANAENVRTVNGLITRKLGRIPQDGERFELCGQNFYVVKSAPNKIISILVRERPS